MRTRINVQFSEKMLSKCIANVEMENIIRMSTSFKTQKMELL